MTVVPLYCAYFIRLDTYGEETHENPKGLLVRWCIDSTMIFKGCFSFTSKK